MTDADYLRPLGSFASLYGLAKSKIAFQLYVVLMFFGRLHARLYASPKRISKGEKEVGEVNTYPHAALFGYDFFVWHIMLPIMWKADNTLPRTLFDAFVSERTVEVGPGSAYVPLHSPGFRQLCRRALLIGARHSYDLVDLNPVPLQYTAAKLQTVWKSVEKETSGQPVDADTASACSKPLSMSQFAADITSVSNLDGLLAKNNGEHYRTLVANLLVHCIPYACAGSTVGKTGEEMARSKMTAILRGMAHLLEKGGVIIGCTVLGPACKDWTHTSNFDRAAAIHASALLRKIGIFDNEFDSLSAFLFGAKAVNLSVKVASVHGNLLTFVLVK